MDLNLTPHPTLDAFAAPVWAAPAQTGAANASSVGGGV